MNSTWNLILFAIITVIYFNCVNCDEYALTQNEEEVATKELGRELVEQGRTLVHHAMKRFMIILPAIFFKLGIAFTLLLLVTIVAVNNGFIGFMILVVGLSSVLARLQDARTKPIAPLPIPLTHYAPHFVHSHGWDRKDDDSGATKTFKTNQQPEYAPQQANYYDALKYAGYNYNYGRR